MTAETRTIWHRLENGFAYVAVALLTLFPALEVVVRKFFHTGVPNSGLYTHHLVLALTFLGGMITARENRHLALSLNFGMNEKSRHWMDLFVNFISAWFLIVFMFSLHFKSFMT